MLLFGSVKRCDYCGKEYPDDVAVCEIDQNPLPDLFKFSEENIASPVSVGASKVETHTVYPDYCWTARDGWKFIGMILVFGVVWYAVMGGLGKSFPSFYNWLGGPFGVVVAVSVYIAMKILTAAYFTRTESWASFCEAVGLNRKPTSYVWFGMAAALGLRLLGHVFYVFGWAQGHSTDELHAFRTTHGPARYLYLFGLIVAAFREEPVNRGFLYKAFRGSYSMAMSMAAILGYTAYTHWYEYRYFGWAVFSISTLTLVQCYLREKGSIWDCIVCHLVFNGSSLFVSGLLKY